MSGGEYRYASYGHVSNFAGEMRRGGPEREAFRKLLYRVSDAMRAVEWHDSGDSGEDEELAAIRECLSAEAVLAEAVVQAESAAAKLAELLREAKQ
jgi:hypothetical protein